MKSAENNEDNEDRLLVIDKQEMYIVESDVKIEEEGEDKY